LNSIEILQGAIRIMESPTKPTDAQKAKGLSAAQVTGARSLNGEDGLCIVDGLRKVLEEVLEELTIEEELPPSPKKKAKREGGTSGT